MKKYLQISVFLGGFFLLVILKNLKGNTDERRVVGNSSEHAPVPSQKASPQTKTINYKDGTYMGSVEDAYYGNIQVQLVIQNGKIADIIFLQYPNDNGTSRNINIQAMPILKSEAIQAQNANVDIVSGASDSSAAFQRSLGSALKKAS